MKKQIVDIIEQNAVYDGKYNFPPTSMLITLLNHYCYGGTKADMEEGKQSGELLNPVRYKTRIIIEVEQYED